MQTLYDAWGQPIDLRRLRDEEATPQMMGVRQILSDHPSRGLTPERLAALLRDADDGGDTTAYLELAEDMEEKDLHYLAELGKRKRAVCQLSLTVESASDAAADVRLADEIRELIQDDTIEEVLFDILDAIGKGYSVTEILWDTSARQWSPQRLVWRDPRWFAVRRDDGQTLELRELTGTRPLAPYKYIRHVVRAKSGLPLRGGLARAAAWSWLFKNYAVRDWVVFAEVFGQPMRLGKYHAGATDEDRRTLLRAVANLGSDAAAVIPESMAIEFPEVSRESSSDLYERLCGYLDRQVSKAVLGQTLTADVGPSGSRALGDVHNEVRRDIMRADAKQLEATLNRDLVRPYIDLNHGPRPRGQYPVLRIGLPDLLGPMELAGALEKLVPLGIRVGVSVVRDRIGLPEPAPGEAVLVPAAPSTPPALPTVAAQAQRVGCPVHGLLATHADRGISVDQLRKLGEEAAAASAQDAIDSLIAQILEDEGWEPVMQPLVNPIRQLLDEAISLEEVRDRLAELVRTMDTAALTESLARAGFVARLAGETQTPLSPAEESAS